MGKRNASSVDNFRTKADVPSRCPAWGKECKTCRKLNHFAKCCRNPKQGQNIRTVYQRDSDSTTESSDIESIKNVKVGRIGAILKEERRPVRKVKIGNSDMGVLIDTRATANVMDEETYKKLFPRKHNLKKATSIMQPYHTDENPTPPLRIIG